MLSARLHKTKPCPERPQSFIFLEANLKHVPLIPAYPSNTLCTSLYKESLDEKERENKHFTKLLAEKDEEVKMYFTGNEELTKSVTFFEKVK